MAAIELQHRSRRAGRGVAEGICQQALLLSAAGQRGETALKLTLGSRGRPGQLRETRGNK